MNKTCSTCKEVKDISCFPKDSSRKDGYRGTCKGCKVISDRKSHLRHKQARNKRTKEYSLTHKEQIKKYLTGYHKTDHAKKLARDASTRQRLKDPLQVKARRDANNAVISGRLEVLPCEHCGSELNIEKHHEDYNKPLDVTFLCRKCHILVHNPQLVGV